VIEVFRLHTVLESEFPSKFVSDVGISFSYNHKVMMLSKLVLILAVSAVVLCQTSQDDFVQFNVPFYTHDWYSGYLNISYKDIHYVYLESQNDRDNDPLVLWVAGGPGCSGLYSMLY
jgi:hypothetical protein